MPDSIRRARGLSNATGIGGPHISGLRLVSESRISLMVAVPSGLRGHRSLRLALACVLALLPLASGSGSGPATAQNPAGRGRRPTGPGAVEGFMVVDCLLPGQIRQLGGKVTYVTARRAVKTAARDCEIRGGEYVSLDRANYATALKVWLPLAEQGDPGGPDLRGRDLRAGARHPARSRRRRDVVPQGRRQGLFARGAEPRHPLRAGSRRSARPRPGTELVSPCLRPATGRELRAHRRGVHDGGPAAPRGGRPAAARARRQGAGAHAPAG